MFSLSVIASVREAEEVENKDATRKGLWGRLAMVRPAADRG